MDPIQVSTIESAILNNLLSGDTCKFIEVVKPLGITDYTGANLFGDSKIDALLNDAMKKIEDGKSCDAACTDLMTYVQSANDPTTVNASMIEDLNNKVSKMSESLSKLTNIISNFSIDGSSKEFQDGKELAKSEPGKSKEDLDAVCKDKGLDGQDATNFKFGYNCVDKKAPNIGSGESKIDQNHSELEDFNTTQSPKIGDKVEYKGKTYKVISSSKKFGTTRVLRDESGNEVTVGGSDNAFIKVISNHSESDVTFAGLSDYYKTIKEKYEPMTDKVNEVAHKYGLNNMTLIAAGSTPTRGMFTDDRGNNTIYVESDGSVKLVLSNGYSYTDHIDVNHSESFSFKDLKQKYASTWSKIMAIGSMLDSIDTSSSDEAKSESEAEALEKLKKLVSDPKDWSAIAYNVLGLSVSPSEYNVFSEVKNMSKNKNYSKSSDTTFPPSFPNLDEIVANEDDQEMLIQKKVPMSDPRVQYLLKEHDWLVSTGGTREEYREKHTFSSEVKNTSNDSKILNCDFNPEGSETADGTDQFLIAMHQRSTPEDWNKFTEALHRAAVNPSTSNDNKVREFAKKYDIRLTSRALFALLKMKDNDWRSSCKVLGYKYDFSEVKNMSNDDKVKDAVKGKVTGTYKWSKDGSTLAVIGVSEDEFNTWKGLVKDVLGDEVTVIGVKDSKDLPSNIQFCDESTNIEYSEDPNKYYDNCTNGVPAGTDKAVDKEMEKEMKSMIPNVNSSEGEAIEKLTEIAEIHNDKIKSMSESVTKLDPENLMIAISKLTDIVTKNTEDIKTISGKIAKFCESVDNDKKVAEITDKRDKPTTEPEAVNHSFSITNTSSADRYQSLKSLFTED